MSDLECPMCAARAFNDPEDLSVHIENHFSSSSNSTPACIGVIPKNIEVLEHDVRDVSLSEQLRQHRDRHRKRFRIENPHYPPEILVLESLNKSPFEHLSKRALVLNDMDADRELAFQLAREEEDLALARAIELSEQQDTIQIVDDDLELLPVSQRNPITQSSNDVSGGFGGGASASVDSFAFNPSMKLEIFGDKNADSGFTCSFDIVGRIIAALTADVRVDNFKICGDFGHFASDPEDYGWSCGYRNAQMLISAIMMIPPIKEQLRGKLGGIYVPSILYLQQLMQRAWNAGWDPQGNTEHRGGIIGSKNWLGPVDLYSMLMNLGIECKIVCFVHDTDREGPHPELFLWAETYFSDQKKPYIPPLYLQHAGHSRTISGVETRKTKDRYFIIFDPSTKKEKVRGTGYGDLKWLNDNFRRTFGSVSKSRYEVLYVTGRVLTTGEMERAKQDSRSGIHGKIFVS